MAHKAARADAGSDEAVTWQIVDRNLSGAQSVLPGKISTAIITRGHQLLAAVTAHLGGAGGGALACSSDSSSLLSQAWSPRHRARGGSGEKVLSVERRSVLQASGGEAVPQEQEPLSVDESCLPQDVQEPAWGHALRQLVACVQARAQFAARLPAGACSWTVCPPPFLRRQHSPAHAPLWPARASPDTPSSAASALRHSSAPMQGLRRVLPPDWWFFAAQTHVAPEARMLVHVAGTKA